MTSQIDANAMPVPNRNQKSEQNRKPENLSKSDKSSPAQQIYLEAQGANRNSQKLLPLLDLLQDETQEEGPLDELKDLLQQILLSQTHILKEIEYLGKQVENLKVQRRR